jgi:hypothetical protein
VTGRHRPNERYRISFVMPERKDGGYQKRATGDVRDDVARKGAAATV